MLEIINRAIQILIQFGICFSNKIPIIIIETLYWETAEIGKQKKYYQNAHSRPFIK